jgi:hypothetical protein
VASLQAAGGGCCSVWTNERLIAERIVRLPRPLKVSRWITRPLRPLFGLDLPGEGDLVRSWFLYDVAVASSRDARNLLHSMNHLAFRSGRSVLYTLLSPHDRRYRWLSSVCRIRLRFPYVLACAGSRLPSHDSAPYIDVRDL